MGESFVVTGGAQGVGRAIVERLAERAHVVALDFDERSLAWTSGRPDVDAIAGDAADEAVAERAADAAQRRGTLAGWINNAAVFRDADLHAVAATEALELIAANLAPALTGCAVAVRRFLAAGTRGAIVNVSSHQARRPVPGALPYATAKAAIEGLTRALAVDYGPHGIRANAVALGSIATARSAGLTGEQEDEIGRLHPLGRAGRPEEVAAVVELLVSARTSFVNGAVVPVDGGRAVLGHDPEARIPRR